MVSDLLSTYILCTWLVFSSPGYISPCCHGDKGSVHVNQLLHNCVGLWWIPDVSRFSHRRNIGASDSVTPAFRYSVNTNRLYACTTRRSSAAMSTRLLSRPRVMC